MAIATFHSLRGEKSALIMVRKNKFVFSPEPAYIPRTALPENIKQGDQFELPDGFTLVDFVDPTTGEVRTTKDGSANLKVLAY